MNRARMSTEYAPSLDVYPIIYIGGFDCILGDSPFSLIVDRIDSMIERRFSRKEDKSERERERERSLENDYQICSSGNWVSDVFPAISAPSVFTLLFVLPRRGFFDASH